MARVTDDVTMDVTHVTDDVTHTDDVAGVSDDITRVMLWVTPRSSSTAFLKCMSNVPGTLGWCEPYWQCYRYSKHGNLRKEMFEFKRNHRRNCNLKENDDHLRHIEGGYYASEKGYNWIKDELGSSPPGKKMVFCKDIIPLAIEDHHEKLPAGFQHTFLIRHPYLTFESWKKSVNRGIDPDKRLQLDDFPAIYMPQGSFFKELYGMYNYAKAALGQKPPVIDTEDLLANPAGVMKAYFNAIGVPYKDEYLRWEPGSECIEKLWRVPKEHIHGYRQWHGVTFESTEFGNPKECPSRETLPEDVVRYAERSMKYYLEMYVDRLKPE